MNTSEPQFSIENKSKPILKWAGGKTSLLPQLLNYFPKKFNKYIEPFLGGGAVFLSLSPKKSTIINEYNKEIFHLYTVIQENPKELCDILDYYAEKYSEEFYYELRQKCSENKIEQAARTVFLNKTGFNGLYRQNSKGEFNVPFGKRLICPALYDFKNILQVSKRFQAAELFNYDFEKIINMAGEGDFIYCDPPYEPLSTTSSFNSYNGIGFSKEDQLRLRSCCEKAAKRGAKVIISNSSASFILDIYKDFEVNMLNAKRAINSNGLKRGFIEEALIIINN